MSEENGPNPLIIGGLVAAIAVGVGAWYLTTQKEKAPQQNITAGTISIANTNISITSNGTYSPATTTLTGTGFTPNTTYTLTDETGVDIINTLTSDSSGNLSTVIVFSGYTPAAGSGYLVVVSSTGSSSNQVPMSYTNTTTGSGGTGLGLGGIYSVNPSISTSSQTAISSIGNPLSGSTNYIYSPSTITIKGTGFSLDGVVTAKDIFGNTIGTYMSGPFGNVNPTITFSTYNPTGEYNSITLTDNYTGKVSNSISLSFVENSPQISISPQSISPQNGSSFTVTGSNFIPKSTGNITANGGVIANYTADNSGSFSTTITYQQAGTNQFTANQVLAIAIQSASNSSNYVNIEASPTNGGVTSNIEYLYF